MTGWGWSLPVTSGSCLPYHQKEVSSNLTHPNQVLHTGVNRLEIAVFNMISADCSSFKMRRPTKCFRAHLALGNICLGFQKQQEILWQIFNKEVQVKH